MFVRDGPEGSFIKIDMLFTTSFLGSGSLDSALCISEKKREKKDGRSKIRHSSGRACTPKVWCKEYS